MKKFAPTKYEKGVWLSILLSDAAVDLDLAEQGKKYSLESITQVKNLLREHVNRCQEQGSLDYMLDSPLQSALIFDVIPKIFGIKEGITKSYTIEHYQEYLQLVLDQFNELQNKVRLNFLREFVVDLSRCRISRLEPYQRSLAA